MIYYKITNEKENHYGFQYHDGLNVLKEPFAETGSCCPGGFYFTDAEHILKYLELGIYLREVTLPMSNADFLMVRDGANMRANQIILGKRYLLSDVSTFKMLVDSGADIDTYGESVLLWASKNGYLVIVKFLVKKGVNICANNDKAIAQASKYGHLVIVKYLVKKGANVSANKNIAIRFASNYGHLQVVKFLIKCGADVHACDNEALKLASDEGKTEIVKFLVECGADIHSRNEALKLALINGHSPIAKILLQSGAYIHPHRLKSAAYGYTNSAEIVTMLMNIHYPDPMKTIKNLLKNGLDVEQIYHRAFMCICKSGDIINIKFFLRNKNLHSINEGLTIASQYGQISVVELLLLNGADPRFDDHSALKLAFQNGHFLVARTLMSNGASLSVYNNCLYGLSNKK